MVETLKLSVKFYSQMSDCDFVWQQKLEKTTPKKTQIGLKVYQQYTSNVPFWNQLIVGRRCVPDPFDCKVHHPSPPYFTLGCIYTFKKADKNTDGDGVDGPKQT